MNTWWNGCFRKMDDLPVHNTPNHQPLNMDVLTKTSLPLNGQCSHQVRPPNSSDDICLLFCLYPSSMTIYPSAHTSNGGSLLLFFTQANGYTSAHLHSIFLSLSEPCKTTKVTRCTLGLLYLLQYVYTHKEEG